MYGRSLSRLYRGMNQNHVYYHRKPKALRKKRNVVGALNFEEQEA